MTEQHVHEFGPPKLATDGGGGSFRQCACGYYSSITFVDGWEQGRAAALAELRATMTEQHVHVRGRELMLENGTKAYLCDTPEHMVDEPSCPWNRRDWLYYEQGRDDTLADLRAKGVTFDSGPYGNIPNLIHGPDFLNLKKRTRYVLIALEVDDVA